MKQRSRSLKALALCFLAMQGFLFRVYAQSCRTSDELDEAAQKGITVAALHYFDLVAKGDVAAVRENSTANLASDFSAIENHI